MLLKVKNKFRTMPASALNKINKRKRIYFKPKKKLKFCADSKRWNCSDFPVFNQNYNDFEIIVCCCALRRHLRKLLTVAHIKKKLAFLLLQLYDSCKSKQKAITQFRADRAFGIKVLQTWLQKLTSML